MTFLVPTRLSRTAVAVFAIAAIHFAVASPASAQPAVSLPSGPVTPMVSYDPTMHLSYFAVTFNSLSSGLSIVNNMRYLGWCGEFNVHFQPGDSYVLYNTYGALPAGLANNNWGAVNWLLNNKPPLSSFNNLPLSPQEIQTEVVQQVIWRLLNGSYDEPTSSSSFPLFDGQSLPFHDSPDLVDSVYNQALMNNDFVPLPGQVVAVAMDPTNGPSTDQFAFIEVKVPLRCSQSATIGANFNGTAIPSGAYVWFNSHFKVSGVNGQPATIFFHNQTITFTSNGVQYNLTVPDGEITFSPTATCARTTFDTGTSTWRTTVPLAGSDEIFISGLAFKVPAGFGQVSNNVDWKGIVETGTPGVTVEWQWGAAAYSQFTTNYNLLQIQATHGNSCSGNNADHAGTPENSFYKQYVIGGARGGGGSNFTGSWSGTISIPPVCSF